MSRQDRDGFVLFSVIWIAGLLAVIATTFAISTRLHVKSQANLAQSYQAEVEADGIVRIIASRLAHRRPADGMSFFLPMDGRGVSCGLDNKAQAVVSLQDQAGLIDLNQTPSAALEAILHKLGIAQADVIAQALVDFRDQDETVFEGMGITVTVHSIVGDPLQNQRGQSAKPGPDHQLR